MTTTTTHARAAFFSRFDGQGEVLALGDAQTAGLSDDDVIAKAVRELRSGGFDLDDDGRNTTGRVEIGEYTE